MRAPATRGIAALLFSLALLVSLPGSAAAAEYRTGDRVTVGADETVDDDLYVAAGTTVIDGTVDGDLTVAAGTVDVRGTVNGSLNVTGGDIRVTGSIGGAVRSFGGNLVVAGEVGRDVVSAGGNVVIEQGASVGGDVAGGAGTLTIEGSVDGDVLAGVGELRIDGRVGGSVDINVGELSIGPQAMIEGDVRYASEREAEIAGGAQIGGEVQRREPQWAGYGPLLPDNPLTAFIGSFLGLLVLGWGLMLARPGWVLHPGVAMATRPLLSFGAGLGAWVGQFLLLIALGILGVVAAMLASAFGGAFFIPLVVAALAILALIFVSQVFVAMAIGAGAGRFGMQTSPWLSYAVGAAIWAALLTLLGWLLAILGALAFFVGWVLGLGALVLRTLDRRRTDVEATTPAQEPV